MEKGDNPKEDDLVDIKSPDDTPTILNDYKPKQKMILLGIVLAISLTIIIILLITFASLGKGDNKTNKKDGNNDKDNDKNIEEKCPKGPEDGCLTCEKGTDKCASCNSGYKLADGKCILNYSFKAVYKTNSDNQNIELIKYLDASNIKNTTVDDKDEVVRKDYTFSKEGEHTIYYLLDISNSVELTKMFYGLENLVSITFTSLFDTKNVKDMSQMFQGCTSLESVEFLS